jgi:hypothetical protein
MSQNKINTLIPKAPFPCLKRITNRSGHPEILSSELIKFCDVMCILLRVIEMIQ